MPPNDNQDSTYEFVKTDADLAVVVGGYNSSNTSHIVELCRAEFPTYFINSEEELKSKGEIIALEPSSKGKAGDQQLPPGKGQGQDRIDQRGICPDALVDR